MNPYDIAHNLAKALRESPQFKEMKEAQAALKNDETGKKMLLDFRAEQVKMYKQQLSGTEPSADEKKKIENLFEVINMNVLIKRLLDAEYKVSTLLNDIQKIISEASNEIYDEELIKLPEEEAGKEKE